MSTDLLNTAFGVLNSERTGRSSKSVLVSIDFRPEHERSTLSFLGMTSTDIEAANYWNGKFMSCDKTEQQSSIQAARPACIRWDGILIPLLDVERTVREVALRLDSLTKENKELALDVLMREEQVIREGSSLASVQKSQVAVSKLDANKQALEIVQRRLKDLDTLKSHRKGDSVPCPVLVPGFSEVTLRYYSKEPASAQMLGYLATARARCKCEWDQLRLIAPKAAVKPVEAQKSSKRTFEVVPCPESVYKALRDKYKLMGTKVYPPANRKGWKPAEIAAYAWCMLINAYNRSWGATGLIEYPKGFPIDRRFANATRRSINDRQRQAKNDVPSSDLKQSIDELKKLVANATAQKKSVPEKTDLIRRIKSACGKTEIKLSTYSWMTLNVSRILGIATSAKRFIESCSDPIQLSEEDRVRYSEASYIFRRVEDVRIEFDRAQLEAALESWVVWLIGQQLEPVLEWFHDEKGFSGDEPDEEWLNDIDRFRDFLNLDNIIELGRTYRPLVFKDEEHRSPATLAIFAAADAQLAQAMKDDPLDLGPSASASGTVRPPTPLGEGTSIIPVPPLEQEYLEEKARVLAADKVGHANCLSLDTMCSFDKCPHRDTVIYHSFADDETYLDDTHGGENPDAPAEDEASATPSWLPEGDIPDYVEEGGNYFVRVCSNGATMTDPSGSEMLAPRRNAFPAILRHGRVYVCTAVAVKLPTKRDNPRVVQEFIPDSVIQAYCAQYPRTDPEGLRSSVPTYTVVSDQTAAPVAEDKGKKVVPPIPTSTHPLRGVAAQAKASAVVARVGESSPTPSSSKTKKAKRGKKKAKASSPLPADSQPSMNDYYSQFTAVTGENHHSKDATINGLPRKEWINRYVSDIEPKSPQTQQAGCICEAYPCRHTLVAVRNRINRDRDEKWRAAYAHAAGKSAEAPKDEGERDKEQLEKENPLRAKNVPRSSQLSQEQKAALRRFFSLPDELPKAEYEALSYEQRSELQRSGTLPRWAVTLVLRDDKNLAKITSGQMTKEIAVEELKRPLPRPSSCASEWSKLKERFQGVQLLEKPRTGKQKALRSAFDKLVKAYPNNPSLPKPKLKEDKGGSGTPESTPVASSSTASRGGGGELASFVAVLKELAPIISLFRT